MRIQDPNGVQAYRQLDHMLLLPTPAQGNATEIPEIVRDGQP